MDYRDKTMFDHKTTLFVGTHQINTSSCFIMVCNLGSMSGELSSNIGLEEVIWIETVAITKQSAIPMLYTTVLPSVLWIGKLLTTFYLVITYFYSQYYFQGTAE